MQNPYEKLQAFLNEKGIAYSVREHEPVYTSAQAAEVRNEAMNVGAKSLLLKVGDNFVLAVLPGGRKLASKNIKALLGEKRLRFATPEEVKEIMGCEIGACYPFGNLLGITTIVDPALQDNETICISPGVHDKTIELKTSDYLSVVDAKVAEISESNKNPA